MNHEPLFAFMKNENKNCHCWSSKSRNQYGAINIVCCNFCYTEWIEYRNDKNKDSIKAYEHIKKKKEGFYRKPRVFHITVKDNILYFKHVDHNNKYRGEARFNTRAPVVLTKRQYSVDEVMQILHDHDIRHEFDESYNAKLKAMNAKSYKRRYNVPR